MALMLPIYDYRPAGVHNTHRMCEAQLGQSGFDVVRHVHDNMRWLYDLYTKIESLYELKGSTAALTALQPYLGDVVTVSENLNAILYANKNIPMVSDLAPRLQAFTSQLEEFNEQTQISKDKIECLIVEGNSLLSEVTNIRDNLTKMIEAEVAKGIASIKQAVHDQQINKQLEKMNEIEQRIEERLLLVKDIIECNENNISLLVHLQASDAVLTYIYTKTECAFAMAEKAIQESEAHGNDESINRQRVSEVPMEQEATGGCRL